MRGRLGVIGSIVALTVLAVVIAIRDDGRTPDANSDATGLFRDPPFSVRLAGPLWQARTLQDVDGAQDFALIERDLPLDVQVTGGSKARVAQLELRVDGRPTRLVTPRCPDGRCPDSARQTFVPPLRALPPGEHRVEILVRDPTGSAASSTSGDHVSVSGFSVWYMRNVPRTEEGRTISKLPAPGGTSGVPARLRRSALKVLTSARRAGGIADALGSASVTVVHAGRLEALGRRFGVTMLVSVTPPRYDLRATVPAYVLVVDSGTVRYTTQQVQMHVAVLRDALIDVDISTGRVITFEPGPQSRTLSWAPSKAPSPAGAADED